MRLNISLGTPKVRLAKGMEEGDDVDKINEKVDNLLSKRNLVIAVGVIGAIVIIKQQSDIRNLTRSIDYMQQSMDVILNVGLRNL